MKDYHREAPQGTIIANFLKDVMMADRILEELTWTTREGEELLVTELGDDHLYNCIKMVERNLGNGELLDLLKYEYYRRKRNAKMS
jgi:hypothetical protein